MEQMQAQMRVLADEMNMLKNEFVGIKAAHASMHQASVHTNTATTTRFTEFGSRLSGLESKMGDVGLDMPFAVKGGGTKPLLKPEQVKVGTFNGGVADGRSKFLEWTEQVKDRVRLYNVDLVQYMSGVEMRTTPISESDSEGIGVT